MTSGVSLEHWLGLFSVILVVAGLGTYAAKKVHNADDFAVAGRSSGVFMVMGTIVGTVVGASSTVGTAQLAFKTGLSAWWFSLGCALGFVVMGVFYGDVYKSKKTTVTQFLAEAYDARSGVIASLVSVLGIFFSAAASSLVLIPMLAGCFDVSLFSGMLISLALVVLYVLFGGAFATGIVGIFKAALLYLVLGVCFFSTMKTAGGITPILEDFPVFPWFSLFPNGFVTDIGAGMSTIIGVMCTQTYIQGFCSAKDEKTAKAGIYLSALFTAMAGLPAVWMGLFMRKYHPDILPIDAMPLFITTYLPDWFAGVSIGMLIIASVGSAAGLLFGMSTIVSSDIIKRALPDFCEKNMLLVTRLTVFVISAIVLGFTYINNDALVLDWTILSMCLRGAGIFIPLIMAIFYPGWFKPFYATLAIVAGSVGALLWRLFLPHLYSPLYPGIIISAVFMLIGFKRKKKA